MIGLARLADRGPVAAALLAAALLFGGLLLLVVVPVAGFITLMLMVLGGAVICYVLLRRGEAACFKTLGISTVLMVLISLGLFGTVLFVPFIELLMWAPALVAAAVLARTVNMGMAVLALVVLALIVVLVANGFTDQTASWRDEFIASLSAFNTAEGQMISPEQMDALALVVTDALPGMFGVSVMSFGVLTLFMARYWQAATVNPGGFQQEFHTLQLGRSVALVCAVVVTLAVLVGGPLWNGFAMVAIFAFFVQGLSVCHAVVKQRGLNKALLTGVYILLLLPNTVLLLGALGLADNVLRLRKI